jgi:DnaJ-class molecular chaperone
MDSKPQRQDTLDKICEETGEYTCPECSGTGMSSHVPIKARCLVCNGTGILDWVSYVRYERIDWIIQSRSTICSDTKPKNPKAGDIVSENGKFLIFNGTKWLK